MKTAVIFIASVLSFFFFPVQTQARDMAVLQPGAPATQEEARPYLEMFCEYLNAKAGTGQLSPVFLTTPKEIMSYLSSRNPAFGMVSAGIFKKFGAKYQMVPLARISINGRTSSKYYVMAKQGSFKDMESLKSKKLAGSILFEPEIFFTIGLAGKYKPSDFKLKATTRTLRYLRKAAKGKVDAVIIDQRAFESLGDIKLPAKLSVVIETEPIPHPVFVSFGKDNPKADAVKKALLNLCDDAEGKKICKNFGFDKLVDVVDTKPSDH